MLIRFRRLLAFALVLLMLCACSAAEKPHSNTTGQHTITDSLGSTASLPDEPRIISLYGSFSQCWMLSGGTLCGITQDAVDDHGMVPGEDLALVGTVKEPNLELVASLSPDYVLLSADLTQHLALDAALSDMNIPHGYFRMDTFSDYSDMMESFCTINDPNSTRFAEYVEKPKENIEHIRIETSEILSENPPDVLLLRAFSTGVKAKTNDNLAGIILDELGAHNIAYDAPSLLEEMSVEAIISADPDYIFISTMGSAEAAKDYMLQNVENSPAWAELSAVKNGRYIFLPKELFHLKPLNRWDESYAYLSNCLLEKTE